MSALEDKYRRHTQGFFHLAIHVCVDIYIYFYISRWTWLLLYRQWFPQSWNLVVVSALTEGGHGGEDNHARETLPRCPAGDHTHPRPQRQTGEWAGHQGLAASTGNDSQDGSGHEKHISARLHCIAIPQEISQNTQLSFFFNHDQLLFCRMFFHPAIILRFHCISMSFSIRLQQHIKVFHIKSGSGPPVCLQGNMRNILPSVASWPLCCFATLITPL